MSYITDDEINGTWSYSCEVLLPEQYFPEEYVNGDLDLPANLHGGTVTFNKTQDNYVEIDGQREWRRHVQKKDNLVTLEKEETIKEPVQWDHKLSTLIKGKQFLYEYGIRTPDGKHHIINGITHVWLSRDIENNLILKGFFFYVPSAEIIADMQQKDYATILTDYKAGVLDWLKLFGKVTLTKKDKI